MTNFFVDTSVLAKRYILETGSTWVKSWIYPKAGHQIIISRLTTVEMIALLMRRQRQKSIALQQVQRVRNNFAGHLRTQYITIEINGDVLGQAKRLIILYP